MKFKKCHMFRDQMPRPAPDAAFRIFNRPKPKNCSHPNKAECRGRIVNAHTVPKTGSLQKIARAGHVYQFRADFALLKKTKGKITETLIGLNDASTFTGFCSFHDSEVFAPIERHAFQATQHHAFLLSYRSICREIFAKRYQAETYNDLRDFDRGLGRAEQVALQQFISASKAGAESGLKRLEDYKAKLDAILISENYSGVRFCTVLLPNTPELVASGSIYVEFDFEGRRLQPMATPSNVLDVITFSVIATDAGGAIVFAWVDEHRGASTELIRSFANLPREQIGDAMVRFLFTYCENTFFSPPWWEQLPPSNQASIRRRASLGSFPTNMPSIGCLLADGLNFVDWRNSELKSNSV